MTLRTKVSLLALICVLAASCSRSSRSPSPDLMQAPVPLADEPRDVGRERDAAAPAVAAAEDETIPDPGFGDEPAYTEPDVPAYVEADEEADQFFDIPFDPEEPAVSEDEVALLDELIELSLPEAPRALTHEEALLHTRSELPLVMNSDVQRLVNYFTKTKRGMATIRLSLGRGNAYQAMIERILEEEDVPAEIFYLAMAESGFRPKARSHAFATGMWQFISSRGKQYGLRQDRYLDLRYDAETATRAAAKHLKDLHIEFKDWYLAMAAYNSGPNRVKTAIRRTGSRDYWTLIKRRALPRETRNYVPIILAMTYVGKNMDLFDLGEIDPAPELRYDTVRTNQEVSFELISDATGSSVEAIKELNQALFRSATPPYGYDLRLPGGSAGQYAREVALVPAEKRKDWRRYEVRPGETLQAVAHRYKVKPEELVSLNALPAGAELSGGMRLTIPTTTRTAIYRYYGGGGAGGLLEPGTGRYRIARGDTLGGIARRFRTSVANLLSWNGLSSTRIRAGRYLIVQQPGEGGAVAVASSGSTPTGRYTVRRGDSLSKIGSRVGASVSQLRAWNGIRGSTIHIGQTLKVPGPAPAVPKPAATASAGLPARSEPAPSANHYRIRSGDTLSVIAGRFGVSVAELRRWNRLRSSRITAGKYLIVRPPSGTTVASTSASTRSPASAARAGSTTHYLVRRGDNLDSIAKRHGTTVRALLAANNLRSSRIYPGQRLVVQGSATAAGMQNYRIRSGDTLAVIAKRFNVTVSDLKRWNGLESSRIRAGKMLVIRSSGS